MSITDLAALVEKRVMEKEPMSIIEKQVQALIDLVRSVEGYVPARERSREASAGETQS